jgi:integrase/recombinase XerC
LNPDSEGDVSALDNRILIERYLASLATQRKLSPHTVSNYGRDLQQLAALLGETALPAVTHQQIRKFASQLHAKGLNPRSIARKLSAWRVFFGWLSDQTALPSNPVDGIKPPKRAKTLPQALCADDAVRLVSQPQPGKNPDSASQHCNRAMFELLYSSGLRVSELVGLDVRYAHQTAAAGSAGHTSLGWIDFDAHEVTVTGKGNKVRSVPVGQAAISALADWLALRETLVTTDPHPLFLSERGSRMSPRVMQLRLKAHAQALAIPADVHPHMLRHSFASHVLQSSGDLRAVQEMLGHSSISSTQVYTSLDFQRLASVYDAAHPRAKKSRPPSTG